MNQAVLQIMNQALLRVTFEKYQSVNNGYIFSMKYSFSKSSSGVKSESKGKSGSENFNYSTSESESWSMHISWSGSNNYRRSVRWSKSRSSIL